jgi:demethylmenaquinone methyltransferase/2-methoxy-6-polyprenyl-1,4-benzoquinol methylase
MRYNAIASVYDCLDSVTQVPDGLRAYAAEALCAPHPSGTAYPRRYLEVGCGTGLNIPFIHARMAEDDEYVGIDISAGMLQKAWGRMREERYKNVVLLNMDAADYVDSTEVDGVLCSLCLCQMPDCAEVLRNLWFHLRPGARLVILDAEAQEGRVWRLFGPVIRGIVQWVFRSDARIRPWKELQHAAGIGITLKTGDWGFYVCWAQKPL